MHIESAHGQHLGEYRGHQTIVAGHHHQTKTRGLGDDDEPAARRVETAGEVKTVHLHYDKYEDFLRPVPLFMSGQGSVVEPPLYTEKYLRALNGQEVREHADKIYITIGLERVPPSDAAVASWIQQVQGTHLQKC